MSRIGKLPISIPEGVEIQIEKNKITCQGPKGTLSFSYNPKVRVERKGDKISVILFKKDRKAKQIWATTRTLIANMIEGVTKGFEKKLEIQGVGFRAEVKGKQLILYVGLSHPVEITAPEGIEFKVEKNIISVKGIDKQLVGQTAAKIREVKKPEPYKGKGIRYLDEHIIRKVGKKTVGAEGAGS